MPGQMRIDGGHQRTGIRTSISTAAKRGSDITALLELGTLEHRRSGRTDLEHRRHHYPGPLANSAAHLLGTLNLVTETKVVSMVCNLEAAVRN
jgi:hypothetical protein